MYSAAIDLTLRTIEVRARGHRNAVVAVVTLITAVAVAAAATGRWRWLAALTLLLPLVGLHLVADARALARWRATLLNAWVRGEIDFGPLAHALRAHPHVPRPTLDAMLEGLPPLDMLPSPAAALPADERSRLADVARSADRHQARQLVVKTALAGLAAAATIAVVAMP